VWTPVISTDLTAPSLEKGWGNDAADRSKQTAFRHISRTQRNLRDDDYVLMICTERYYARVMHDEDPQPGIGLGGTWEGGLIFNQFYKAGMLSHKFLPLLLKSSDTPFIPDPFAAVAHHDLEQPDGFERLYRRLTDQSAEPPPLGAIVRLPPDDGGAPAESYQFRVDPTTQPGGNDLSEAMAQMREQLRAEVDMRLSSIVLQR